jgi:hypothetical protein
MILPIHHSLLAASNAVPTAPPVTDGLISVYEFWNPAARVMNGQTFETMLDQGPGGSNGLYNLGLFGGTGPTLLENDTPSGRDAALFDGTALNAMSSEGANGLGGEFSRTADFAISISCAVYRAAGTGGFPPPGSTGNKYFAGLGYNQSVTPHYGLINRDANVCNAPGRWNSSTMYLSTSTINTDGWSAITTTAEIRAGGLFQSIYTTDQASVIDNISDSSPPPVGYLGNLNRFAIGASPRAYDTGSEQANAGNVAYGYFKAVEFRIYNKYLNEAEAAQNQAYFHALMGI